MGDPPILRLEDLSRRFGQVQALDGVSFDLRGGEVHALMGENGAGKSTLIRLIAGLDRPDAGRITLNGVPQPMGAPAAMRAAGLRFIHQELHAVRGLSVAENMHLDHPYPRRGGLVDWRALNRAAREALARLGVAGLDVRQPMTDLTTGQQMIARIAATLIDDGGRSAWLYVMDEPTAALTGAEAETLFAVIGSLTASGAGVLYVSHRMPEVLRLADRVTVLRDGRHVSTRPLAETGQDRIIREMTGRDLSALFPERGPGGPGEAVLEVRGLTAPGLFDIGFSLRAGEILGVAGLAGAGRGALLRALMGAVPRSGTVTLGGRPLGATPARAWRQGLAYVPRERRSEGLMLRRSIIETVALPHLTRLSRAGLWLSPRRQRETAESLGRDVRLKATSGSQACEELSGGNQQKVLFARALAGAPRVLLLDEPTRGVDVGAKFDLYRLIRGLAAEGVAVMLASSDLPEVLGLADRVLILHEGRLAGEREAAGMTEGDLLAAIYGARAA
jgi:ABC-type sugar transport system ATPase subunit